MRSVGAALLAAAAAAAILSTPMRPAKAESRVRMVSLGSGGGETVNVAMGKTETLRTRDSFVDLVVGDPAVADVMPLTNRSFYVQGKKRGTTTISAYDPQRRLIGNIEVEVGFNLNKLQAELRRRLPHARIRVSSLNGNLELSGTVPDAPTVDRAMLVARQFDPKTINSMEVAAPQQVMLEVRFVEASRNAGRELGVDWKVVGKRVNASTGAFITGSTLSGAAPFGSFLGNILRGGTSVDMLINALEQKGLGRRLAEPNLIAMSGEKASFLAGGEFPFPVPSALGQPPAVQFKKFGVGLTFTPTVLANGLINLKIEPEVSQIDKVTQWGPSVVVRRANTMVQLRDGQSFAIAGLLQSESSDNAKQLPWIGNVPVLGTLFRSAAFERKETDLAIIVTPRIVRPAAPNQPLRTPLDASKPANDVDRFLLQRQEVTRANMRRTRGKPAKIAVGHILDLDRNR
ncbi:MAG: type II and III secretion system protein family protein [Beijerinckiaceae bacterium]